MIKFKLHKKALLLLLVLPAILFQTACITSSDGDDDPGPFFELDDDDDLDTDPEFFGNEVNKPDTVNSSDYYPGQAYTALLSGAVIGSSEFSNPTITKSLAFNQRYADDLPLRVRHVSISSYTTDGNDISRVIISLQNISDELACGSNIRYTFLRDNGDESTWGGNDVFEREYANWDASRLGNEDENFLLGVIRSRYSCVPPNSIIYIRGSMPWSVDDTTSVEITSVRVEDFEGMFLDDGFTPFAFNATTTPVSYTVGALPASDTRVRTGASDEFIILTVVNNGSVAEDLVGGTLYLLNSLGLPFATVNDLSDPDIEFLSTKILQPGEEYDLVYRNNIDVGEVTTIRPVLKVRPFEE